MVDNLEPIGRSVHVNAAQVFKEIEPELIIMFQEITDTNNIVFLEKNGKLAAELIGRKDRVFELRTKYLEDSIVHDATHSIVTGSLSPTLVPCWTFS